MTGWVIYDPYDGVAPYGGWSDMSPINWPLYNNVHTIKPFITREAAEAAICDFHQQAQVVALYNIIPYDDFLLHLITEKIR